MNNDTLQPLLTRLDKLLILLEQQFPSPPNLPDWTTVTACRWNKQTGQQGYLEIILQPHHIQLDDLQGIDLQKAKLKLNTQQFLHGRPANNALLWGSRGTGKSSLIKALLNEYHAEGLRLIEVEKYALIDLPAIVASLYQRPERFIIFCDDLSFEANEPSYKALKSILDGSLSAAPDNVLIYATSNRRHLIPEYQRENLETHLVDEEIHHGEAVEEKISLSERFGLWLSFYPFNQTAFLQIVRHWLQQLGTTDDNSAAMEAAALQWALVRGSRSGRSAWQFARDWAGQQQLKAEK